MMTADDRHLVVFDESDGRIRIHDADSGDPVAAERGPENQVNRVLLSPDGKSVAVATEDGTLHVHDVPSARWRAARATPGRLFGLAFSPDGRRLFTGGDDGRLVVWSFPELERLCALPGHGSYIFDIAVALGGRAIATASGDTTVHLWTTIPWRERYAAGLDLDRRHAAVEPMVRALHRELGGWTEVADALEDDDALGAPDLRAAIDVVRRLASKSR